MHAGAFRCNKYLFRISTCIGLIFLLDLPSETSILGRNLSVCKWDFFHAESRAGRSNFHKILGGAHNWGGFFELITGVGLTGSGLLLFPTLSLALGGHRYL